MRYFIQFITLLILFQSVYAESIDVNDFKNIDQEDRYTDLINNIRCPVCQGQSIGGSNSSLAKDLRKQVQDMILSGDSNKDIYFYMVERYGDFVVFKPPVNYKTYFLWFTPLLFLVTCCLYLFRATRKKNHIKNKPSQDIERVKNLLK